MSEMLTGLGWEDGLLHVKNVQDVEPVLNACKAMSEQVDKQSKDMRLAASIPMVIIEQYCHLKKITFEEWQRNKEHIRAVLNDPDLKAFRVWPGRV